MGERGSLGLLIVLRLASPIFAYSRGVARSRFTVHSNFWLSFMASNPWDIRPASKLGDSNENAIFNSVGRALTEWEHVENGCARLFAILVSAHRQRTYDAPAVRAYGCVVSFKSRAEMLRNAATAYFAKRKGSKDLFEKAFKSIMKEYVLYSDRRNEIAHGCVQNVFVTGKRNKRGRRYEAVGLYLLPSFYNPKKFKDDIFTYRYTSSDVTHYAQEFLKLHLRISDLVEKMARAKPTPSP
jgi:hypothetical protein